MDRLAFLGLDTLEYKCLTTDLVMMYKIVHHLVDVDHNALIAVNSSSVARNSLLKLYKPTSISSVRSNFLSIRSINVWNYLSEETRSCTSLSAFKNCLATYNLAAFLVNFKS